MIERLIKLLHLTSSTNDHEALLAIRRANQLLTKEGRQWKDVISAAKLRTMTFRQFCDYILKHHRDPQVRSIVYSIYTRAIAKKTVPKKEWDYIEKLYNHVMKSR